MLPQKAAYLNMTSSRCQMKGRVVKEILRTRDTPVGNVEHASRVHGLALTLLSCKLGLVLPIDISTTLQGFFAAAHAAFFRSAQEVLVPRHSASCVPSLS